MHSPQTDPVESEFAGTYEQFKQRTSEFLKRLKESSPTEDQVNGGLRGLRLSWLYIVGTELERSMALTLITISERNAEKYLRGSL